MFVIFSSVRFTLCGVGGIVLLSGFVFLTCIDQDDARHNFGHSGGMVYIFYGIINIHIALNFYIIIFVGLELNYYKIKNH